MNSSRERQTALVEEIKTILREKGQALDPETLARLSVAQSGTVTGGASRFAAFWRTYRTLALLLLAALFALLFFFLTAPEPPAPPAGPKQGMERGQSAITTKSPRRPLRTQS